MRGGDGERRRRWLRVRARAAGGERKRTLIAEFEVKVQLVKVAVPLFCTAPPWIARDRKRVRGVGVSARCERRRRRRARARAAGWHGGAADRGRTTLEAELPLNSTSRASSVLPLLARIAPL